MHLDHIQKNTNLWYGLASERRLSDALFEKKIWRVDDVAKFLGCSVGHVYNLAADEKIPKLKKRGFLFFVPEQILNWVMEGNES